jgi:hypothetical protein
MKKRKERKKKKERKKRKKSGIPFDCNKSVHPLQSQGNHLVFQPPCHWLGKYIIKRVFNAKRGIRGSIWDGNGN